MIPPVTFSINSTKFTLEANGHRQDLICSGDPRPYRKKIKEAEALPFKKAIIYPNVAGVVCSFFCPWGSHAIAEQVQQVLEGAPPQTQMVPLSAPHQMMKLPKVSLIERLGRLTLSKQPTFDRDNTILLHLVRTALQVDKLMLFHFLSKKLSQETQFVIARELRGKEILSEVSRRQSPLVPKNAKVGITVKSDKKRKEHYSVHCYIAFPLVSNAERLKRISKDLSCHAMLQMAFANRPETMILPYDLGDYGSFEFTFLKKLYTVNPGKRKIKYFVTEENKKRLLFSHTVAESSFCGNSHEAIQVLFQVLAKFIGQLDAQDQEKIFDSGGPLVEELFNDLFAFRVQVSFPDELTCAPYSHPTYPLTQVEDLANASKVALPDLKGCLALYREVYDSLPKEKPDIDHDVLSQLFEIHQFFNAEFDDGRDDFADSFRFYGAISAQLLLHFTHKITPKMLRTVMQLDKWDKERCAARPCPFLLIKDIGGYAITVTSLIEQSLQDRDPIELRMPPNGRYDTQALQAETDYLAQLSALYAHGSPLLESLAQLAKKPVPMSVFSQDVHVEETTARGLERFAYRLYSNPEGCENLHGFTQEQFEEEFYRGMLSYFSGFEKSPDQVQAHIVDCVKRLVDGASLLEPRFKHYLLDDKHFTAGMLSSNKYHFVDGAASAQELIVRALYEIQRQKKRTVNAQLIVDAVYMFLKNQPPVVCYNTLLPSIDSNTLAVYLNRIRDKSERESVRGLARACLQPGLHPIDAEQLVATLQTLTSRERESVLPLIQTIPFLPKHLIIKALHGHPGSKWPQILEFFKKINISLCELVPLDLLVHAFDTYTPDQIPYVAHCLNLAFFQQRDTYVQAGEARAALSAVFSKVHAIDPEKPDLLEEKYFMLFPELMKMANN